MVLQDMSALLMVLVMVFASTTPYILYGNTKIRAKMVMSTTGQFLYLVKECHFVFGHEITELIEVISWHTFINITGSKL